MLVFHAQFSMTPANCDRLPIPTLKMAHLRPMVVRSSPLKVALTRVLSLSTPPKTALVVYKNGGLA